MKMGGPLVATSWDVVCEVDDDAAPSPAHVEEVEESAPATSRAARRKRRASAAASLSPAPALCAERFSCRFQRMLCTMRNARATYL